MMDLALLADAVVNHLNGIDPKPFEYQAKRPKAKADVIAETSGWNVFVVPEDDDDTPVDHSDTCEERLRVRVILNGPTADMNVGIKRLKQVKRLLRQTEFHDPEPDDGENATPYRFQGTRTMVAWDAEAIVKKQYLGQFEAEYFGVA